MATNLSHEKGESRLASTEEAGMDNAEQAMKPLKICPRKVLGSLSHLRIDRARIKPIESQAPKLGGKADVGAATLDSGQPSTSLLESEEREYLAVKKLRFDTDTDDDRVLAPFAHEVSLLANLSHENVVKIVGFVEDTENGIAWMVFSWEKNGNLREFVRSTQWELPELISLIHDVAQGLSYLHGKNPPICHGDLKSLNILVNSGNRAVIMDFGSARAIDSATETTVRSVNTARPTEISRRTSTELPQVEPLKAVIAESGEFITMTGPAWTVRWAAPELLDGALPSLESDIWALGWICWEAVTGNFPFDDVNEVAVIRRITSHDLPTLHNDAHFTEIKMLCSLMEDCLSLAANERPAALRCQQALSFMNPTIPCRRSGAKWVNTQSSGLLYAIGRIQLRSGRSTKAQDHFEHSLKISKSVGDERGRARALTGIGDVYRMQDEYSKAEESYIQSRDIYSKIGCELGFAQSVQALGDVHRMRDEYSRAEESYIQSRDIYSKIGYQLGFAQSVLTLGHVYRMRDEYSKAEELFIQSRDIYSKIGYQLGFAHSVQALGDVYRMRDEDSKAEESYIQSRDLYSKIGNQLGLAQSVQALGDIYRMRKEYSKAEESYIQSRGLYSNIGDRLGFAQSFDALGEVYRMRHEYSKAEESYIRSRDIYSKIGERFGFAQSLEGIGRLHKARREYANAAESYLEAQTIYRSIGDSYSSANICWHLGWLHRAQAQYVNAERLVREASALYGELGLTQRVADCHRFIDKLQPFI